MEMSPVGLVPDSNADSTNLLDALGVGGEFLQAFIIIGAVVSVGLIIAFIMYGVRLWMVQAATFKIQKDVAEIKTILEQQQTAAVSPVAHDLITNQDSK